MDNLVGFTKSDFGSARVYRGNSGQFVLEDDNGNGTIQYYFSELDNHKTFVVPCVYKGAVLEWYAEKHSLSIKDNVWEEFEFLGGYEEDGMYVVFSPHGIEMIATSLEQIEEMCEDRSILTLHQAYSPSLAIAYGDMGSAKVDFLEWLMRQAKKEMGDRSWGTGVVCQKGREEDKNDL